MRDKPEDLGFPPVDDNEAQPVAVDSEETALQRYAQAFTNWRFLCACVAIGFQSMARYGLITWVPLYYLSDCSGQNHHPAKLWITLSLPLGMALGALVGGYLSDRVFHSNRMQPIVLLLSLAAVVCLAMYFVPRGHDLLGIGLLFLAGFFVYGPAIIVLGSVSRPAGDQTCGNRRGSDGRGRLCLRIHPGSPVWNDHRMVRRPRDLLRHGRLLCPGRNRHPIRPAVGHSTPPPAWSTPAFTSTTITPLRVTIYSTKVAQPAVSFPATQQNQTMRLQNGDALLESTDAIGTANLGLDPPSTRPRGLGGVS